MSDGVDPAELWERYLEEIRADRGTPSPQGAMAFAVDALTTPPAAAQSNGDAVLRTAASLFSESAHENYTREEVVSVLEDMIRIGQQPEDVCTFDWATGECQGPVGCKAVAEIGRPSHQLEAARKALEEIPRLVSSARYDEPANGSAESAWNAACDHIEEGIAALAALEKPQS